MVRLFNSKWRLLSLLVVVVAISVCCLIAIASGGSDDDRAPPVFVCPYKAETKGVGVLYLEAYGLRSDGALIAEVVVYSDAVEIDERGTPVSGVDYKRYDLAPGTWKLIDRVTGNEIKFKEAGK